MRFALFALYVVTGLLLLEGISALLHARSNPARVRERLRRLSRRVVEIEARRASLLRRGETLRLPRFEGLEKLLYRAGGRVGLTRFLVLSAALAAVGYLSLFLLTASELRAVPGLVAGVLPWLAVRRAAAKRMRAFQEQLPDAIELLTRSLRTGHALGSGFQMVGEEFADPIGTEFGLVAEEIRLGLEPREALGNLMSRVENEDLPYFTTAVMIQRQTGGNLAEVLDNLSALLRERIQFHGRVRAMTAQGRGAATFLALWLPTILLVVWVVAPGYLEPLVRNSWGHAVLGIAFAIDALAYYMALRIADVQA